MAYTEILLSTAYLPPVQYLSKFLHYKTIRLEVRENFLKQTYRNRTLIAAANGPESLVIPVAKGRDAKHTIKDQRISYDTSWQHIHWHAIVSAYRSSPFFEILQDEFRPFYRKRYSFLFDFNLELLRLVLNILDITPDIRLTEDFEQVPDYCLNYREAIHPKPGKTAADKHFVPVPYSQVFEDRLGFLPNLSVIDLLFNRGPESYEILLKSIR
ncbi:MAG: WbqC family protein [Mangrovibacterium sp.]